MKDKNTADLEVIAAKNDLTEAGVRLLKVITKPENRLKSITDICVMADIARGTYYNLFRTESFTKAYIEACQLMLLSYALPASAALGEQAKRGDTGAIKMVLELAGLYQNTATLNVNQQSDKPSLKDILKRKKVPQS